MKVLLIAFFSNSEIRDHLGLCEKSRLTRWALKLCGLNPKVEEFRDFGAWITNIISFFEKQPDYELHVLSPHIRLKHSYESFELRGIHYHFFRSEYSSMLRKVGNYRIWKLLQNSGRFTKKVLRKVNPSIVVLSGTENPVASVSILSAKNYPRLCLCQVIYNDPERSLYSLPDKLKIAVESDIFGDVDNFGVYCKKHYNLLMNKASGKNVFKFNWPPKGELLSPSMVKKEYDFVNFALSHSLAKGTHDSIKALALVKKHFPNVSLNIVGGCGEALRKELEVLIDQLQLSENVFFTPFFEKRSDLLIHVQKSKFAVLPCKLDNVSGTMAQAMLLQIPLVVYATPGTIKFNRERECAFVVKKNDIDELASQMERLLSNPNEVELLRENGRWYMENQTMISLENWKRLVHCFDSIIDSFKTGSAIPGDQLFNPESDD